MARATLSMRSALSLLLATAVVASEPAASDYDAALQLRLTDPAGSMRLLQRAAAAGHAEAQAVVGVAHAQGQGGLAADRTAALRWLRAAAVQGHTEATFNLVTLCDARRACLEAENDEQALRWLREAATQGHPNAAFEAASLLLRSEMASLSGDGSRSEALEWFLVGARLGHASAMFNAASLLYHGGELTHAVLWFGRAAAAPDDAKASADARIASARLRRLWVQEAEAANLSVCSDLFAAAGVLDDAATPSSAVATSSAALVARWRAGAAHWARFEAAFSAHASYENREALDELRGAMAQFGAGLRTLTTAAGDAAGEAAGEAADEADGAVADEAAGEAADVPLPLPAARSESSEMRRYLLLSKLSEGAKALGRDDAELARGVRWVEALSHEPLCEELYAEIETNPSCFNDQLASAITMRRCAGQWPAEPTDSAKDRVCCSTIEKGASVETRWSHARSKARCWRRFQGGLSSLSFLPSTPLDSSRMFPFVLSLTFAALRRRIRRRLAVFATNQSRSAEAEELTSRGRAHAHAATRWTTSAQTPRVFVRLPFHGRP